MSDILIRGMEMPTEYRTEVLIFKNGFVAYYDVDGRYLGHTKATQLPEGHGRLIDADVMVEGLMKCAKNPPDDDQNSRWFYLFAAEIAKSCETIVPAEGGTDNG